MTNLINLTCPTCGGTIEALENNQFICQNCQNKYLLKQDGSQINLVPLVEEKGTLIEGNHNVVVNVNTGTAQAEGTTVKSDKEKVECPICGRMTPLDQTFRCRRCGRAHICTAHQDSKTFLCFECMNAIRNEQLQIEAAEHSKLVNSKEYKSAKGFSKGTNILAIITIVAGLFCVLSSVISELGLQNSYGIYSTFYNLSYIGFIITIIFGGISFITGLITLSKKRIKSGLFGIGALLIGLILTVIGNVIHGSNVWY